MQVVTAHPAPNQCQSPAKSPSSDVGGRNSTGFECRLTSRLKKIRYLSHGSEVPRQPPPKKKKGPGLGPRDAPAGRARRNAEVHASSRHSTTACSEHPTVPGALHASSLVYGAHVRLICSSRSFSCAQPRQALLSAASIAFTSAQCDDQSVGARAAIVRKSRSKRRYARSTCCDRIRLGHPLGVAAVPASSRTAAARTPSRGWTRSGSSARAAARAPTVSSAARSTWPDRLRPLCDPKPLRANPITVRWHAVHGRM